MLSDWRSEDKTADSCMNQRTSSFHHRRTLTAGFVGATQGLQADKIAGIFFWLPAEHKQAPPIALVRHQSGA